MIRYIADKLSQFFLWAGDGLENWVFSHSPRLKKLRARLEDKRAAAVEYKDTEFGKKRKDLIAEHQVIIEDAEEKGNIKMWVQDVLNDYDELINEYGGLLPLQYSQKEVPNKEWVKEGREIEVNILHSFPAQCPREKIAQQVTEIIKHVQENYYPETPIWVEVTQHKEVKE